MKHRVILAELNGDWNATDAYEEANRITQEVRRDDDGPTEGLHAYTEALPAANLHHVTETLTTPELSLGDIVLGPGGMLCLLDEQPNERDGVYWTHALVLNRDAVSTREIPFSFTAAREPGGRMRDDAETQPHRWSIQGNELAHWLVIRATKG